jgi:hypothetical protein
LHAQQPRPRTDARGVPFRDATLEAFSASVLGSRLLAGEKKLLQEKGILE